MLLYTDLRDQRSCTYFLFVMQDCYIHVPCRHWIRRLVYMLMYIDQRYQRLSTYVLCAMRTLFTLMSIYAYVNWSTLPTFMYVLLVRHADIVYVDENICLCILIYVTNVRVRTSCAPFGHCVRWWEYMLMYTDICYQRSCTYFLCAMRTLCTLIRIYAYVYYV